MKKASKAGYLYMRQGLLTQHAKYLALISGDYLYLFNQPTDSRPLDYYYIRGASMLYLGVQKGLYVFAIENDCTRVEVAWPK